MFDRVFRGVRKVKGGTGDVNPMTSCCGESSMNACPRHRCVNGNCRRSWLEGCGTYKSLSRSMRWVFQLQRLV